MSYAVVYSSHTGNTALLARTIRETLGEKDCVYFGEPSPAAAAANTIYVGFWTDKGSCDETIAAFLKGLTDQQIFLFATAGFGGSDAYFEQILNRAKQNIGPNVSLIGSYMCQGKMPRTVRERYEKMEEGARRDALLENFDQALGHPNQADLERLKALLQA